MDLLWRIGAVIFGYLHRDLLLSCLSRHYGGKPPRGGAWKGLARLKQKIVAPDM